MISRQDDYGLDELGVSFSAYKAKYVSYDIRGMNTERGVDSYTSTVIEKISILNSLMDSTNIADAMLSGEIGDLGDGVQVRLLQTQGRSGLVTPYSVEFLFDDGALAIFTNELIVNAESPLRSPVRNVLQAHDKDFYTSLLRKEQVDDDVHIYMPVDNNLYTSDTSKLILHNVDVDDISLQDHFVWGMIEGPFGEAAQSIDDIIVRPGVSRKASWNLDEIKSGLSFDDQLNQERVLTGTSGSDRISGGLGNDLILGEWGQDTLFGLAGDDEINGGAHYDKIYGGDGDDILAAGSLTDGNPDIDVWLEVDRDFDYDILYGGAGSDLLIGSPFGERARIGSVSKSSFGDLTRSFGGLGDDFYSGPSVVTEYEGEGFDTLLYATEQLDAYVEAMIFDNHTSGEVSGNELDNLIVSLFEQGLSSKPAPAAAIRLNGMAGDDILIGSFHKNELRGGDGDDFLDGGVGGDYLAGGVGDDYFIVDTPEDTVVEAENAGLDTVEIIEDIEFTLPEFVENIVLGIYAIDASGNNEANHITGNAANNSLNGLSGDDVLLGGDGDDVLNGGDGADELRGGLGDDIYFVTNILDTVIEAAGQGYDAIESTVVITIPANIEVFRLLGDVAGNLSGFDSNDVIWASNGQNVVKGFGGRDKLYGQGGDDILSGHDGGDLLDGGEGDDQLGGGLGSDSLLGGGGADRAWGGDGDDSLIGNAGDDTLRGDAGADRAWGGDGSDIISGGEGMDRLWGGNGDDVLIGGSGDDLLRGEAGNDKAFGGDGDDYITGDAGDDLLYGEGGSDNLIGGEGNDLLAGGAGADRAWGGLGNDTYIIEDNLDRVREDGNAGDDIILVRTDEYRTVANVELVQVDFLAGATVYGSNRNDVVMGGSGDDILKGGGKHDSLDGAGGADVLVGHGGYDRLIGGAGDDILVGGAGRDHLFGGEGSDVFIYDRGDGFDRIHDFEVGVDTLNLHKLGLEDFDAFSAIARTTKSGDTLIDFGEGDIIVIFGVVEKDIGVTDILT